MLQRDFPVVDGPYRLTDDWMVTLPFEMNRRFEDDSLVLWRRGFTIWISVWGNDHAQTCRERFEQVRRDANPERFGERLVEQAEALWFSYRLKENHPTPALYAFAFAPGGHIQAAMYFDAEDDAEAAVRISQAFTVPPS